MQVAILDCAVVRQIITLLLRTSTARHRQNDLFLRLLDCVKVTKWLKLQTARRGDVDSTEDQELYHKYWSFCTEDNIHMSGYNSVVKYVIIFNSMWLWKILFTTKQLYPGIWLWLHFPFFFPLDQSRQFLYEMILSKHSFARSQRLGNDLLYNERRF